MHYTDRCCAVFGLATTSTAAGVALGSVGGMEGGDMLFEKAPTVRCRDSLALLASLLLLLPLPPEVLVFLGVALW
jgi:hypothetical protein